MAVLPCIKQKLYHFKISSAWTIIGSKNSIILSIVRAAVRMHALCEVL